MFTIKQPSAIIFGKHSARDYDMPKDPLVITSKGAKSRGWLDYTRLNSATIFDNVEPNPSIETVEKIINEFSTANFSHVVGLGGGSSLDVAKYVAFKLKKRKIMVPTTFGSGSEVTRISVLKVNGKKQSFHDDGIFADVAIVDSFFIYSSEENVIKNSAIDACAQCTEGFDSKLGNEYTKFLCKKAFDLLEDGILHDNKENIVLGSLFAGLGFGNCSTTLGHALSYVYSNEGYSHGHALAFTTTVAHQYNQSVFYDRFLKIVKKLNFSKINLKQNLDDAASLILTDRKHLDNNPKNVAKDDVVLLLKKVNSLTI
jgi:succinate semialdehyde reductase